MNRPELVIITGFLGAGKTTILSRLLDLGAALDTGVVINEAGAGVDDVLLQAEGTPVTVLQNGCLCCRSKGSLSPALSKLMKERERQGFPQFKRIAVETSGLADPAPVLEEIASSPFSDRVLSFAGLVTIIDARAFDKSYADHPQVALQVAFADRLLIAKTDLVTDAEREGLQAKLAALNPEAPQIIVPFTGSPGSQPLAGGARTPRSISTPQGAYCQLENAANHRCCFNRVRRKPGRARTGRMA